LIICIQILLAKWTAPLPFIKSMGFLNSVYEDPTSGTTHILGVIHWEQAFYIKVDNEAINRFVRIDCPGCNSQIIGSGDGLHFFIVYWYRDELDGKSKIYFMDGDLEGNIWSEPRLLTIRNQCEYIKMDYISETNRLYILYQCIEENNENQLYFVSRPANSTIFSQEILIYKSIPTKISASVAYTMKNGKPLIHIGIQNTTQLFYTNSHDNGVTWKNLMIIGTNYGSKDPQVKLFANSKFSDSFFILFQTGIDPDRVGIIFSNNYGDSFYGPEYENGQVRRYKGQICGSKTVKMLATTSDDTMYTQWTNWEKLQLTKETRHTPFDNGVGIADINCAKKPGYIAVGYMKDEHKALAWDYFDYDNDNDIEIEKY